VLTADRVSLRGRPTAGGLNIDLPDGPPSIASLPSVSCRLSAFIVVGSWLYRSSPSLLRVSSAAVVSVSSTASWIPTFVAETGTGAWGSSQPPVLSETAWSQRIQRARPRVGRCLVAPAPPDALLGLGFNGFGGARQSSGERRWKPSTPSNAPARHRRCQQHWPPCPGSARARLMRCRYQHAREY